MKKSFKKCVRIILILFFVLSYWFVSNAFSAYQPKEIQIENVEIDTFDSSMFVDCSLFYYNQLTDSEKEVYQVFSNSKNAFINNEEIYCLSSEELWNTTTSFEMIKKSMTAYCYDIPESTIYINHYMIKAIYNIQNNCYDYYVKPHIKYKNYSNVDTKEIENNLEEIEQVTKEFVMTLSGTDAEKLTQIHNWLIDGARYDMTLSLPNTANIYGAIIDKSCICAGFANAFKYVADMADLKVIYVTGTAFFSGTTAYHAWNLANVEGKWKIVDVTWDLSCSNEYEFSKRFLLIFRDEENGTAHIPETEKFVYPD